MQTHTQRVLAFAVFLLSLTIFVTIFAAPRAFAQDSKTSYPSMAPADQYMMPRDAEIALARSAAPPSISHDAEVLVMNRHGYEVAAKGANGFVCMVLRSWAADVDHPDFWNPKIRGAICLNPAAAQTYLPMNVKKTELILAGKSKAEMVAEISHAFDAKELPPWAPGAMSYMMSKDSYLSDRDGHWHPHLMFFAPLTAAGAWGANADGSPLIAADDPADRLTIFLLPVGEWSDGTPGPPLH